MDEVVNIQQAKTHLSRLVEQAAKGRQFVIAKAGKPMVRVVPIDAVASTRALGFFAGKGTIDGDLRSAFANDIDAMFQADT